MKEIYIQDLCISENKIHYNNTLRLIKKIFNYNDEIADKILKELIESKKHYTLLYVGEDDVCDRLYNECHKHPLAVTIHEI
jgi:hypothetical protein